MSPDELKSIEYQMGQLTEAIRQHTDQSTRFWEQMLRRMDNFDLWREKTEARLGDGAANFVRITARLDRIEETDCIRIVDVENVVRQAMTNELSKLPQVKIEEQAITFKYIVDKFTAPIVTGVITALLVGALIYYLVGIP